MQPQAEDSLEAAPKRNSVAEDVAAGTAANGAERDRLSDVVSASASAPVPVPVPIVFAIGPAEAPSPAEVPNLNTAASLPVPAVIGFPKATPSCGFDSISKLKPLVAGTLLGFTAAPKMNGAALVVVVAVAAPNEKTGASAPPPPPPAAAVVPSEGKPSENRVGAVLALATAPAGV